MRRITIEELAQQLGVTLETHGWEDLQMLANGHWTDENHTHWEPDPDEGERSTLVIQLAVECAQFMEANTDVGLNHLVMVNTDTIIGFGDAIRNIMLGLVDGMAFIRRAD